MKCFVSTALAVIMILALAACGGGGPENQVFERADLNGKAVGVLEGSSSPGYAQRYEGELSVTTFSGAEAMAAALKSGAIDCAIADAGTFDDMRGYSSALKKLDEPYVDAFYTLAVSADNRLMLENLNAAIGTLKGSGELDRIADAWKLGLSALQPAEDSGARTITVAVCADFYPFAFYGENGELTGLEIDIVGALCAQLGLTAEFIPVEADMLLYMAESGKTSFAVGRIEADPENAGLAYTESYLHSTQFIVVRK